MTTLRIHDGDDRAVRAWQRTAMSQLLCPSQSSPTSPLLGYFSSHSTPPSLHLSRGHAAAAAVSNEVSRCVVVVVNAAGKQTETSQTRQIAVTHEAVQSPTNVQ